MLIGINYPWIDYGWDFGDPPKAWVQEEDLASWRENRRIRIDEDFRLFASQSIFAVRWFLLADGLNYGIDEFAPQNAGKSWSFDPLPEDHSFYNRLRDDFEFVLRVCSKNSLKLFPSLIDFHWCRQGIPVRENRGIIKGGRYDVVRDSSKRQAFFDRILDPLLEISLQYCDSIFAWELINEPEWVVRKFSLFGHKDANRNISQKEMMKFIAEGARRINAKQRRDGGRAFQSSVGFAHWETLNKWNAEELGLTLHQFHYYAQNSCDLPACPGSANRPCIVGEFATAAGMRWPDLKSLNMEQTITNRLRCLENKGYSTCFLWSARAADTATSWTDAVHREVIAYTRSQGSEFRV